jgi:hypothetical protein
VELKIIDTQKEMTLSGRRIVQRISRSQSKKKCPAINGMMGSDSEW